MKRWIVGGERKYLKEYTISLFYFYEGKEKVYGNQEGL